MNDIIEIISRRSNPSLLWSTFLPFSWQMFSLFWKTVEARITPNTTRVSSFLVFSHSVIYLMFLSAAQTHNVSDMQNYTGNLYTFSSDTGIQVQMECQISVKTNIDSPTDCVTIAILPIKITSVGMSFWKLNCKTCNQLQNSLCWSDKSTKMHTSLIQQQSHCCLPVPITGMFTNHNKNVLTEEQKL